MIDHHPPPTTTTTTMATDVSMNIDIPLYARFIITSGSITTTTIIASTPPKFMSVSIVPLSILPCMVAVVVVVVVVVVVGVVSYIELGHPRVPPVMPLQANGSRHLPHPFPIPPLGLHLLLSLYSSRHLGKVTTGHCLYGDYCLGLYCGSLLQEGHGEEEEEKREVMV